MRNFIRKGPEREGGNSAYVRVQCPILKYRDWEEDVGELGQEEKIFIEDQKSWSSPRRDLANATTRRTQRCL